MASGVLYDGGIGAAAEVVELIEQTLSTNVLNSWRWDDKKVFIGSIHCSFWPKEVIFAKVCTDLAMSVRVRRAFGLG